MSNHPNAPNVAAPIQTGSPTHVVAAPTPATAQQAAPSGPRPPPPSAPSGKPSSGPRRIGDAPPGGKDFVVEGGIVVRRRAVVYGPPGIGKTTLASMAPTPLFLDLQDESGHVDVKRVPIRSWDDLRRAAISPALWGQFETIVIDNVTRAQQLASEWTCANVADKKGEVVQSIEQYGYGGGPQLRADVFRLLLQDLDTPLRAGKNVILIAHATTDKVPNPRGEDYLRWEPDLYQTPPGGKSTSSLRNAVVQWADHVLGVFYDVSVGKDSNVGQGSGTRTIYTSELPSHVAKTRLPGNVPARNFEYVQGSNEIWRMIGWAK